MGLLWIEQKWEEEGRDEQTRREQIVRMPANNLTVVIAKVA